MIRFGCDVIAERATRIAWPKRVAMLTNDAARLAADPNVLARKALLEAGVKFSVLLSPEHGLTANSPDGVAVPDAIDTHTGLHVVSLYGDLFEPSDATLHDIDAVIIDLPDVGTRYYTYAWSALFTLLACARMKVPVIALDRPNPIGGVLGSAEGPVLDVARFGSFLGRDAIPIRHSLTLGELLLLWRATFAPDADLEVVPCEGWSRAMEWPDTGIRFTPSSPSMPSFESALLYPGFGLFEATNLSVGRGTSRPFQCVGAPWLKADAVVAELIARGLTGVTFESLPFEPSVGPFAGKSCQGVLVRVADSRAVRPVAVGIETLAAIRQVHRKQFRWKEYPTAANPTGHGHFERLIGVSSIRDAVDAGIPSVQQVEDWTRCDGWDARVAPHLLYT
jgi:uncharacterized protein YbbC (DUF1343 family)